MLKIFIAGGSGYIGRELINFFIKLKIGKIYATYYKNKIKKKYKQLYISRINLTRKKEVFKKLKKINPDLIINLAAFTDPQRNELNPKKSFKENFITNKYLTDYCKLNNKKIIFTSTDKVYGGKIRKPCENIDINPNNIYGINKLKSEQYIKKNLKKYLILRYATVYSKKKYSKKNFINISVKDIKNRKKIFIASNIYRSFLSIEYLLVTLKKLINKNINGTYNIGHPVKSYYDLIKYICIKKKIKFKDYLFKTKIETTPQYLSLDTKKINSTLMKFNRF
jgi:dTDP-4-dehydrorhamnose reductase